MGGLGVTANELFMYPYWILEKGYAANLKDVPQPEWRERARQWIRAIYLDAGISTLVATAMTAAFFLLGCAILFRRGEQPTGLEVVNQISSVYTEAYGAWSRWLFLIGAFSTLFSTLVVVTAASGRMIGDLLSSMKYIDASQPEKLRRCHQWVQVLWLLGLLIGFLVQKSPPEQLVILGHWIVGAVLTPLLMLSICWLAFHTDRRARMSSLGAVLLVTSTAIIAACVLGGLIVRYVS